MKSLLSNYFNRLAPTEENKQLETSSFSSLASTSTGSSSTSSVEQQQNHNDSNLNIKYIDDIDTDGVCYSSTDEYDEHDSRRQSSNDVKRLIASQMKSSETVIKTLEKINESFQFLFEDCNERNVLNKQSSSDFRECFFLIKRLTKESQDYYKKIMDEIAKQEDCTHRKMNQNELENLNKNLTDKIRDLTEKLHTMETVNKQQKDELERMKDICETMRSDRKRLKGEKIELLSQAKELYSTIELKENELRDFLRHYESKTKETSFAVKRLIDTKAVVENEKIDLQTQVFELLEEKNDLKLMIESKNATITKLQKQLFEMNTKSIRHSLSKESDYGYVSTKASRDTLSSSLIENLKHNDYDMSKIKLNTRSKEERMMKCKSNDYQQQILKNKLKNKSHQQFDTKDASTHSNSSNQSIIDYESDLNKVLDSEAFIDLDTSCSEKDVKPNINKQDTICQSFSSDCILIGNTLNCTKQGICLNKIDETNNNNEENSSCTSSVVSFTKSTTSSSASVSNSATGSSLSNSESESSSIPSMMSRSLHISNDKSPETEVNLRRQLEQQNKLMTTSVHVESRSKSNNHQSRSSRILNSLIKMSTTAATVGSTGSSINIEPSIASKVPLFTTTLSSSKIKPNNQKVFNSTISMNRPAITTATTKSLYSICDLKNNSNGNIFKQDLAELNEPTEERNAADNMQVSCAGLKNITFSSCLKIDSLDKTNNINEWPIDKVKSWLEKIGMQQSQIKNALKYIKNGKTLLNLSDNELERMFLIGNSLHKRKLRLAIEELKFPEKCKYPKINDLTTDWICNTWLKEIGLVQYKSIFKLNLIDGRVLNSLLKKDLEKYMSIHKKNTQTTLLTAIEFLRKYDFDLERIKQLRETFVTNGQPNDTSLWSNENFISWLKLVNLQAFTKNLPESGIHGALVHDNTFTVDFLYQSLMVTDEPRFINMKKILEDEIKLLRKPRGESKDPSATFARANTTFKSDKKPFTLRGSLGRALGKKIRRDISSPLIDDDTYRRIEFSHKIVDMKNFSTTSIV